MMDLIVHSSGTIRCIYDEAIPLSSLGQVSIQRGSHVEPNATGQWMADLSPVNGPKLEPFSTRTEALAAEVAWLRNHWLTPTSPMSAAS